MLLDSFQKVNKLDEMVAMHMQLLSIHRLYPILLFYKTSYYKNRTRKKN